MNTDTSVVYFDSTMVGAPAMSYAAGGLLSVLKACLVTGFGSKSVDSLVVSGGVATATISTGHGLAMIGGTGPVIEVAGATPAQINGRWRVNAITNAQTLSFSAPDVANLTATGSITLARASAGWEERYSGTNKSVFARTALDATAMLLKVDDTGGSGIAIAKGFESMDDLDTGSGPFFAGNGAWFKSNAPWLLIADHRMLYCRADIGGSKHWMAFGDPCSFLMLDPYGCAIVGADEGNELFRLADLSIYGKSLCRSYSQSGSSVAVAWRTGPGIDSVIGTSGYQYPAPGIGGLIAFAIYLDEGPVLRGTLPGLLAPAHNMAVVPDKTVVSTVIEGHPRDLLIVKARSANDAALVLDISGPWR